MKASPLRQLWDRLPVLLRAAVVAWVILSVGQLPAGLFLAIGLRVTPSVPWFLIATVVWLWLFWRYLDGRWWPPHTARIRKENLRAVPLSSEVWLWSVLGGGFGMVSVLSGALLTGLIAELPAEAYEPPFDLSPYRPWTVLAFFLNVALVAGVVEEAAFRGSMLSMVERRHGWVVAVTSVAALFYLAHMSHAYATVAFVPFFMVYGLLHGVLVFLTRSILPSVLLHVLGDLAILPIQYGVVVNPLGPSRRAHLVTIVGFALASAVALWRLAHVRRHQPGAEAASLAVAADTGPRHHRG